MPSTLRTKPSPMYRDLAVYYDRIYSRHAYRREAQEVVRLVRRYGRSGGRSWLDVACGTGRHLELLRHRFDVVGLDLSRPMLRLARRRLPGIRLVSGDMRSFRLGRRFDVVTCLFSAIGYLRTEADLRRAFRTFADHLRPGGVVVISPWVAPDQFRPGHHAVDVYQDDLVKIVRASSTRRQGDLSLLTFDYLIADGPGPFRHVREVETLRLTAPRRLAELLGDAGLRTIWRPPSRGVGRHRGWLIGVAPGNAEGEI